jgi:hypothetical protein
MWFQWICRADQMAGVSSVSGRQVDSRVESLDGSRSFTLPGLRNVGPLVRSQSLCTPSSNLLAPAGDYITIHWPGIRSQNFPPLSPLEVIPENDTDTNTASEIPTCKEEKEKLPRAAGKPHHRISHVTRLNLQLEGPFTDGKRRGSDAAPSNVTLTIIYCGHVTRHAHVTRRHHVTRHVHVTRCHHVTRHVHVTRRKTRHKTRSHDAVSTRDNTLTWRGVNTRCDIASTRDSVLTWHGINVTTRSREAAPTSEKIRSRDAASHARRHAHVTLRQHVRAWSRDAASTREKIRSRDAVSTRDTHAWRGVNTREDTLTWHCVNTWERARVTRRHHVRRHAHTKRHSH